MDRRPRLAHAFGLGAVINTAVSAERNRGDKSRWIVVR